MIRNRLSLIAATWLAIGLAHSAETPAQQTGGGAAKTRKAEPVFEMTVKVYRVDDLVLPSSDYPFRGTSLPGMAGGDRSSGRGMMMGMMGGGMGMGGGGEGGQDSATFHDAFLVAGQVAGRWRPVMTQRTAAPS